MKAHPGGGRFTGSISSANTGTEYMTEDVGAICTASRVTAEIAAPTTLTEHWMQGWRCCEWEMVPYAGVPACVLPAMQREV